LEESDQAELVLYEGIAPGTIDYSTVVQKIRRSGADAVIYGGYHPGGAKILIKMRKKR
jgi:branched-chain amino acid transport system substrate-binding protein